MPAEVQRAPWSPALQQSLHTEMTLDLPLQGVRESYFEMSVPHLRQHDEKDDLRAPGMQGQRSEGSVSKDCGELRDVKDII